MKKIIFIILVFLFAISISIYSSGFNIIDYLANEQQLTDTSQVLSPPILPAISESIQDHPTPEVKDDGIDQDRDKDPILKSEDSVSKRQGVNDDKVQPAPTRQDVPSTQPDQTSQDTIRDQSTPGEPTAPQTVQQPVLIANPADPLVLVNKSHSLPANYRPADLVVPQVHFYFAEDLPKKYMQKDAAAALEKLFAKATQDGIEIYAASGYRSYQRQKGLFSYFSSTLGVEAASRVSARPGQSEHQTGLAMDVTSRRMGFKLLEKFGETKEGIWLAQNAPNYGFILRYPQGKEAITGYQYEPWHLRYVGVTVAKEINRQQITLEEYFMQPKKHLWNPRQQIF